MLESIEAGCKYNEKDSSRSSDVEKSKTDDTPAPEETVAVLDWDGPDDPGNPVNWSAWKKARHFYPVSRRAITD